MKQNGITTQGGTRHYAEPNARIPAVPGATNARYRTYNPPGDEKILEIQRICDNLTASLADALGSDKRPGYRSAALKKARATCALVLERVEAEIVKAEADVESRCKSDAARYARKKAEVQI